MLEAKWGSRQRVFFNMGYIGRSGFEISLVCFSGLRVEARKLEHHSPHALKVKH